MKRAKQGKARPKFNVGQVVVNRVSDNPMRITRRNERFDDHDKFIGYEYIEVWSVHLEEELRPLTARERGEGGRK